jgi:hypothetical protein
MAPTPSGPPLAFFTRLWLAWVVSFRVLFDGAFAARVLGLRERAREPQAPALPAAPEPKKARAEPEPEPKRVAAERREEGALMLLSLLQREGRLVDFLQQDITTFDDADVGAAARVVHQGCKKALAGHVALAAVRAEAEGAALTLAEGFDKASIKLTGDVGGDPPYAGTLRHKGWRVTEVTLPEPTKGHDPRLVCPAEVEL